MRRFEGQVAIVTGAASGIGHAVAVGLVSEGASVLMVDHNDDGLAAGTSVVQGAARPIVADVAEPGTANRCIAAAHEMGSVRLLVAAAGLLDRKSFLDAGDEIWLRLLSDNVLGCAAFAREAAVAMRAGGGAVRSSWSRPSPGTSATPVSLTRHRKRASWGWSARWPPCWHRTGSASTRSVPASSTRL